MVYDFTLGWVPESSSVEIDGIWKIFCGCERFWKKLEGVHVEA